MRCPSCGTQNEADSRFCGGCGARLTPSRLAPTQKIAENAPAQPVQHAQLPRTPSISQPPPVQPMAPSVNRPPRVSSGNVQPPRTPTPVPEAASSLPAPRRRWGLVIGVLVIDVGLAAAGAWLLSQGLASSSGPAAPATRGSGSATVKSGVLEGAVPTSRAAAALPAPTPPPPPSPPSTVAPTVTPIDPAPAPVPPVTAEPAAAAAIAPTKPPRAVRKKQRANRRPASAPLDPYSE